MEHFHTKIEAYFSPGCDLSFDELIDAVGSRSVDREVHITAVVFAFCNFIVGVDDVALWGVKEVHSVLRRDSADPIVLSRRAVLYKIA